MELLSRDEEAALGRAVKRGGPGGDAAADELVLRNIWLARHVASRCRRDLQVDDAEGAARLGLVKAARRWDADRGVRFGTYAYTVMRHEIADERERSMAAVPMDRNTRARFERYHTGGSVVPGRHAKRMGDAVAAYARLREVGRLDDLGTPDEAVDRREKDDGDAEITALVLAELEQLPDRERAIIRRRFGFEGEPETLAGIGERLGLTRERVRQLERIALERLRAALLGESAMLDIGKALALTDRESIEREIHARVEVMDRMVGWLYPSILEGEVEQLRARYLELWKATAGRQTIERRS
jgi:RNA polymerase sigma factor (sigma-70 family)